jgi:hypothetical protein
MKGQRQKFSQLVTGSLTRDRVQVHPELFAKFFLNGFVEKGFGCGYVSFFVKSLSFVVLRLKAKPTSKNRYVAETQTDKRETALSNSPIFS